MSFIPAVSGRDFLNIFVLVTFAISQPILSLLGNNTLFFIVRRSDLTEILLFVFVICFAIPGLAALTCFLLHRVLGKFGDVLCVALYAVCLSLLIAPMLTDIDAWGGVVVNICIGTILAVAYFRLTSLRTFVSYLLPAVVVFPLAFLFGDNLQKAIAVSDPQATPHQINQPSNVIMIVFDSMPLYSILDSDRKIDGHRFPNFAKLSEQASWYRNASTPNDSTWWAVPSLLTGRELHGEVPLPIHSVYPENLFTAFGHQMDLHVNEYISRLCPLDLCSPDESDEIPRRLKLKALLEDVNILYQHTVYPKTLTERLPRINETLGGFAQGNTKPEKSDVKATNDSPKEKLRKFIASFRESDKPQLYFLHALAPHAPWRYTPTGKEYGAGHFAQIHGLHGLQKRWGNDEWAVNIAYQRHLMQVGFVDFMLGQVIEKLQKEGLYDESMLIVLSDHGSSYKAGDFHRAVTAGTKEDIIGIPLIIKYPGQRLGSIDDRNVNLVDVMPTIFEQLGVDTQWAFDGISLLGKELPDRDGKHIRNAKQEVYEVSKDYYLQSNSIESKFALLETGKPIGSEFNISLHPNLNGKNIADIALLPSTDEFLIHDPQQFLDVDLNSDYLPALVNGKAPGLELSAPIAIALNGKIVTVTRIFSYAPELKLFAAIIPEQQFRNGNNTLSLHRVEVANGKYTLYQSKIKAL